MLKSVDYNPLLVPTEMRIVAYHNKGVVYAYKGIYNGGLDVNWSEGVLNQPSEDCGSLYQQQWKTLNPYIGSNLGGLTFDKASPGVYTRNYDTYSGSLTHPRLSITLETVSFIDSVK